MIILEPVFTAFKKALNNALNDSIEQNKTFTDRKAINRTRSANFIHYLTAELTTIYENDDNNNIVLSKGTNKHRRDFGMNELLYDILVCETEETNAAINKKILLKYISKGIWAIESELKKDSKQALIDFNKLILSSCESKLFIGPLTEDNDAFLQPIKKASIYCTGSVYVTLIPHPGDWEHYFEKQESNNNNMLTFADYNIINLTLK